MLNKFIFLRLFCSAYFIAGTIGESYIDDYNVGSRFNFNKRGRHTLCQDIASQSHESLCNRSNNWCVHSALWKQYVTLSQRNRESRVMWVANVARSSIGAFLLEWIAWKVKGRFYVNNYQAMISSILWRNIISSFKKITKCQWNNSFVMSVIFSI